MSNAPAYSVDPQRFAADPYPDLAVMRAERPICFVPELGATLITRRDDVFEQEKRIETFSSRQPGGLMTRLMGENMMRKDGAAHMAERRAIFPTVSPRTVRDVWLARFRQDAQACLQALEGRERAELVRDFAMPLAGHALRAITGLENMSWQEMDRVSQGMIDGIANYLGDPEVEARCNDCTASIDRHVTERMGQLADAPDHSLLSVQMQAGLSEEQTRANIKLAISGGQNEPRDAIAGAIWALLSHPAQLEMVRGGQVGWMQAFEEYARWISPIGMSPREVARQDTVEGVTFEPGDRVFLMFGSANRDERVFDRPEIFDITRDTGPAVSFGAGPHFCAGAWASRALIADVALPMFFARFPEARLDPARPTRFFGWAFRGPEEVHVLLGEPHRAA